mgnify:CR=1 FL=1
MLDKTQISDVKSVMADIGLNARAATQQLATASTDLKNRALLAAAESIWNNRETILEANGKDMKAGSANGLSGSFMDRLMLDEARIEAMMDGLRQISELKDPVGDEIDRWQRPNGLDISRVRTPLGVIGVIFESRPNVTADAGALCLKSGNAVILRGGTDSYHSSNAIHACLVDGLKAAGLPDHAIQIVPTTDRAAVGEMLTGLDGNIDVIVPFIEQLLGFKFFPPDVYYISAVPSKLVWSDVWYIAGLSFVLTLLATLYPARKASKVNPAEALRYE